MSTRLALGLAQVDGDVRDGVVEATGRLLVDGEPTSWVSLDVPVDKLQAEIPLTIR